MNIHMYIYIYICVFVLENNMNSTNYQAWTDPPVSLRTAFQLMRIQSSQEPSPASCSYIILQSPTELSMPEA